MAYNWLLLGDDSTLETTQQADSRSAFSPYKQWLQVEQYRFLIDSI